MLQIVTGILLAIVYVPSAGEAWNSLQVLNQQLPLGWFLRAMHGWGSNFMVAVVLIHMCQVFLFGAYKFPRELTWILGVFLLLMTLGMAFTGQVMRFDQDAYWGLGIGASIVSRVPFIGGPLVDLLLGGPIIAGPTLDPLLCLACLCYSGNDAGFRRAAHLDGGRTGYQRLAHAGADRPAQHLHSGVPRADAQGRHSFRTRGGVERHDIFRSDPVCGGALRGVFGALWADRLSRSNHHPDRAQAGLLLLMALHHSLLPPGEPGDAIHIDCSGRWGYCSCWHCRSLPEKGRRAGAGGRSRCCRSPCSQ